MVMSVLWTRLSETGKDWRYVYKVSIFLTFSYCIWKFIVLLCPEVFLFHFLPGIGCY